MIDALLGEQWVSISAVIPLLNHVYDTMEHDIGDTELTYEIKE